MGERLRQRFVTFEEAKRKQASLLCMCTGALLPSLTTIPQLGACVGKAPKDYDSERLSQDFHCSGAIVCLFVEFSMQLIYES